MAFIIIWLFIRSITHYVGQVKDVSGDVPKMVFMRRSDMPKRSKMSFVFQSDDLSVEEHSDVVLKQPKDVIQNTYLVVILACMTQRNMFTIFVHRIYSI